MEVLFSEDCEGVTMQFRCKHARILFTPDYQEYCKAVDGTPQCNGCKLVELRTGNHSIDQMIDDNKHATTAYDYTTGGMVMTW